MTGYLCGFCTSVSECIAVHLLYISHICKGCVCACVCVLQQQNSEGVQIPVKHQLLQVIVRVLQYRMLLTGNLTINM